MAALVPMREIDVSEQDADGNFIFGQWLVQAMDEAGVRLAKELAHVPSPSAAYIRMLRNGKKSPSLETVERMLEDLSWQVLDRKDGLIRAAALGPGGHIREVTFTKGSHRPPGKSKRSSRAELLLERVEELQRKVDEIQGAMQESRGGIRNLANWTSRERLGSAIVGVDKPDMKVGGETVTALKLSLRIHHQRGGPSWRYVKIKSVRVEPGSPPVDTGGRWKIWEPGPAQTTEGDLRRHPDHVPAEDVPGGWSLIGEDGWHALRAWIEPDRIRDSLATFPPTFWAVFETLGTDVTPLISRTVNDPDPRPAIERAARTPIDRIIRALCTATASGESVYWER